MTSPQAETATNAATTAAVRATVREAVACLNAGKYLSFYALYSDAYYQRLLLRAALQGEPILDRLIATLPAIPVAILDVREIIVLPDGRVSAVVVTSSAGQPAQAARLIFIQSGSRWLIDDATPLAMPATPAP